jgi:hypothetical protein
MVGVDSGGGEPGFYLEMKDGWKEMDWGEVKQQSIFGIDTVRLL